MTNEMNANGGVDGSVTIGRRGVLGGKCLSAILWWIINSGSLFLGIGLDMQ